jgi:hypothetical protein
MELNLIKILKKFTNIVVHSLSWLEQMRMTQRGERIESVAAFTIENNAETLYLHKEGSFIKNQVFWEENIVTVMTHEKIHIILYQMGLDRESTMMDKVFRSISKSNFFVDGDWEWLKGKWRWDGEKWSRMNL